ncbi:AMP-dependent synthetase/ligase [Actinomycetospora chiangmaiensis]|uniref:AMP-dependent synthetase/ligase n=1 Tax=Actinomycetospora chiangmaiensis TaxID=402650 RepID=UPI000378FAA5|nr:AMP-dependent synthetase/ligase [Actinomycetospora chiangmaiensis]
MSTTSPPSLPTTDPSTEPSTDTTVTVARATTPPGPDLPPDAGLAAVLDALPAERVVIDDPAAPVDAATLRRDVHAAAARLVAARVGAGDRVAVLGRTSLDWVVADLASLAVGAVVVPIYPTSSAEQVAHVLADSGTVLALAETEEGRDLLRAQGPGLRAVLPLAGLAATPPTPELEAETVRRRVAVRRDDLATIVYTSGTTGRPKGCMLSHRNMFVAAAGVVAQTGTLFAGGPDEQARTVLGLPLSHVFGRTVLFACLVGGTRTTLAPGVPELLGALPTVRPTFLTLVPYALEKMRKGGVGTGGALTAVISGGASLDPSTEQWATDAGITVYQGYGLTETATAATINGPGAARPRTVGRPIPGVTVALAADGEVLVAGANVTAGYWGREPEHTDGWLHTGDLGRLDADGFLTITGRAKEILVTSGGKNVAPAPLEDRIRLHPLVANAMVLGDGRPYVTALVTVDRAALAAWAARTGHGVDTSRDDWTADPALRAEIAEAVGNANDLVSRAESVREFRILPGDLTIAAGHLTPSLKLRRAAVLAEFAADVTALYS